MDSKALVDFAIEILQAGAATFLIYGAWLCFRHAFLGTENTRLSQAALRSIRF